VPEPRLACPTSGTGRGFADVEAPSTAQAGAAIKLRFNVRNVGTVNAIGNWIDRLVLSSDDVIGNSDDILLTEFSTGGVFTTGIGAGGSYGVIPTVTMPAGKLGTYRIGFITDATSG
jgi:hypothetical protein